jgi:hypothetical protein
LPETQNPESDDLSGETAANAATQGPATEIPLNSSRELWAALCAKAGLSLPESDRSSYDEEILAELRASLVAGEAGELGDLLERHGIPIERLLVQFLRAAAPFARMMTDVLVMFEKAGASRTDQNLKLAIDIGGIDQPLEFDLESFRDQVAQVTRVIGLVHPRGWTIQNGWELTRIFEKSALARRIGAAGYIDVRDWPRSPQVRAWLEQMSGQHFYPDLPPVPLSGDPALDDLITDLWADFQAFQSAARQVFGAYAAIIGTEVPDEFEGWPAMMLRASHDFWPRENVRVLAIIADVLAAEPEADDAHELADEIAEFVASISGPPVPGEVLRRELEDLFSLPVWQKRHELYSVWIAAVITKVLAEHEVTFHPQGDTLSFPFRKTHLATIGQVAGHRLELWSELRSDAVDPIGRKEAIQPDYRLRAESRKGPGEGEDFLITECKQYRTSDAKNFSAALTDYARASPGTPVTLVNYGPVGPAVMKRVHVDVADRCHAFAHVRPGGAGLNDFTRCVSNVGQAVFRWASKSGWAQEDIEVELRWQVDIDLDLHVTTPAASCGYNAADGLPEARYGGDDLGNGPGPHSERIVVQPDSSERLDFVVHAYSRANAISDDPEASATIRWRVAGVWHSETISLSDAHGQSWHIARFEKGRDRPQLPNRSATGFTSGSGWDPPYI